MSLKATNNSADSNGLVSTLLVFSIYSKMTKLDALSFLITQRAMVMKKAMDEIRKYTAL